LFDKIEGVIEQISKDLQKGTKFSFLSLNFGFSLINSLFSSKTGGFVKIIEVQISFSFSSYIVIKTNFLFLINI
jgi:hypothetical protein